MFHQDGGITASVDVAPQGEGQNVVVVFQLVKDDMTPVSIVALERNISELEKVTAHFNVDGSGYSVKVFVFDEFTSDPEKAPTSLAKPVILK
ncbi:MAG: hypothetical protein E6230_20325 [Paenibacillus dendritiformis]|uniref:hypothetical protein n=2 Tax=Paenibacillus dendritiformis TaxID=130049 RepID=UPI001B0CDEC4|nr:hypothetical protein [Paenibacillus dendritiformis]MDU5144519.1 hypothetical protein [Paenibacillus dendritiformis]GIO72751.1 hypothetical protein J27TS7_22650 [Paenibacillus dendritiformis]